MTDKEKKLQLARLDEQVLDLMIKATAEGGNTGLLTELSVPVNYLKSNAVITEKERSTNEDSIKKRVQEAKERRKKNEEI